MKVIIAGDFCPRARGQKLIESGDFSHKFIGIPSLTRKVDFSIVNFETNISTNNSKPIIKNGPCLTTNENSLRLIKYLGFNVVTLANNHFYDCGNDAVENTLQCLDRLGIKHVGGGKNITDAKEILFLKSKGETLAVINACEHEFSIATDNHGGSYGVDPIQIFYDIQEAKDKADYILVVIHGGHEYHQLPSIRMQEWYRFFIDAGADAVINHHQHCFSGREIYKNKPIYYGLGNFFFDKNNQKERTIWNEGLLVQLNFTPNEVYNEAIPYIQCLDEASVVLKNDDADIKAKFEGLSKIIGNDKELLIKNKEFYSQTKRGVISWFQPFSGRLMRYAFRHKLLPSVLSKKRKLAILNMIVCEAHYDRIKCILKEISR